MKQIETFIKPTIKSISTGNHNGLNASCHNIHLTKIPQSTRIRLEIEHISGKSFQSKFDHPETTRPVKTIFKF